MNKWLHEHNLLKDGHKFTDTMTYEDKIIHKMHKFQDALDTVNGKTKFKEEEASVSAADWAAASEEVTTVKRTTRKKVTRIRERKSGKAAAKRKVSGKKKA